MTAGGLSVGPSPLGTGDAWVTLTPNASPLLRARCELPSARGPCLRFLNRLTFTFPIVLHCWASGTRPRIGPRTKCSPSAQGG